MEISTDKTLLEYFYHWEKAKPNEKYLFQPFGDDYFTYTWEETGTQVRKIASYLKSLELPPHSNIGIVSKNCAEWVIADLAIMLSGHISVPFYATLTAEQLNQVLVHSESKVLFVGKLDGWETMKSGIPTEVKCISFPVYNPDNEHVQWDDIIEKNARLEENYYPAMDDICSTIYTSGTTGNPKGVMLTYKAFSTGLHAARNVGKLSHPNTRFFSYLPLSHIAERMLVESASLATGGVVYFTESLESFTQNLKKALPTHFLAVPRIWTKFQLGILAKMPQKKLNLLLKIPILNSIVKNKIKKNLGLENAVISLTGAAPMPVSLIRWFRALDIHIQEAYGMTENLGAVCMMPLDKMKDGFVGKLYPNMEVKIDSSTGEICTRSAWNMLGYFKEPELTAETIDADGWIHTGDVGVLDEDNYLRITGRVKEMYKTSKGEYVAPAQIEFGFADNNNIEQICVVGQSLPQPIALVVLSDIGKALSKDDLVENLKNSLSEINTKLKSYEKIKKIVILKEPWTVDNNKLTPTFKIKRAIIEKEFVSRVAPWYESAGQVIWE